MGRARGTFWRGEKCRVNVLGRPGHRCEFDDVNMGFTAMLWEGVEQIRLAEGGANGGLL